LKCADRELQACPNHSWLPVGRVAGRAYLAADRYLRDLFVGTLSTAVEPEARYFVVDLSGAYFANDLSGVAWPASIITVSEMLA
jgi:hypothetical protein